MSIQHRDSKAAWALTVAPRLVAVSALLILPLACGGGSQPAQSADDTALLEEEPQQAAAAPSSNAVQQGIDALQAQDFAKAKQILADAHAKDPKDPQAAFYYGVALEGTGEPDAAVDAYKQALTLDPKLAEASQNLSAVLLDKGDLKGALEAIDGGLAQSPGNPVLLTNRAVALEAAGSPEALGAYAKAVEKSPEDGRLRYSYALALAKANKQTESLAELKKIPTGEPEFASAVADAYLKLGAFDDCIKLVDAALAKKPTAELWLRRGNCNHGKKDRAAAVADFQSAIKLDESFAAAHFYLGRELAGQGKIAEGRAELEKAAKLGAGSPVAAAAQKDLSELDAAAKSPKKAAPKKK
jgi:tetratricopeptide (TPR) repeat protein